MAEQCISEALQCYGGYGFSEEYPIAEIYRNVRIYSIWEGTNYIQSLDLVGRKMTMKKGEIFAAWLQHIRDFITSNVNTSGFEQEFSIMADYIAKYDEILKKLRELFATAGMPQLYATRVLHATGKLWAGKLLLEMALIAQQKIDELGSEHFDYAFYAGKVASARFFVKNIVPEIASLLEILNIGDASVLNLPEEIFFV